MSTKYRFTANLSTTEEQANLWFATARSTIDEHCIVQEPSFVAIINGMKDLHVVRIDYTAAGDAEAKQIILDALRAVQQSVAYDTVRICTGTRSSLRNPFRDLLGSGASAIAALRA